MEAEAEAAKGHNVEIATVYQHHWHQLFITSLNRVKVVRVVL